MAITPADDILMVDQGRNGLDTTVSFPYPLFYLKEPNHFRNEDDIELTVI